MTVHLSMATEGLAPSIFSHRLFASLGFGYSVEVIITPLPVIPSGVGIGGGISSDRSRKYDSTPLYDITFIIRWDGKVVTRSYKNILFDTVIGIVIKFKAINIFASFKGLKIIRALLDVRMNSSKHTPIDISVQEKQPTFSIKRHQK